MHHLAVNGEGKTITELRKVSWKWLLQWHVCDCGL